MTVAAFKMPKSLAQCADLYYATMQERLALQRKVEALKETETQIAEYLINNLKKDTTGIAGKVARVFVTNKTRPQVDDWNALYAYIVKEYKKNPGVFSLLQRRVGEEAVNELWEASKKIPGVSAFTYPKVGYSTKLS